MLGCSIFLHMKKTVFVVLTLAIVALVAASGCISTPEEPASPVGVWLVPGQDVTLIISPDGTYGGSAQVNSFSGTYTVDSDTLTFSEPIVTLMAGPGLEEEQVFFATLASVDSFDTVEGGKLLLKSGDDTVLVLLKSIAGTWVGENGVSLTFNTDMTLSGTGPVNSFSGTYANKVKQPVLYITERAVFELREEGVTLIEIAPGIDLQTQILDQMEFMPKIAEDLKLMDERIFRDELMGLAND